MNAVDSCGWLEFLANGPNAGFFAVPLADASSLVVPAISIYEVFKRVLVQRGEGDALQAVALMQQGNIVDFNAGNAISAARVSVESGLPMADAIMLSVARAHGATLWTQDAHFDGIDGVKYVRAGSG
ncbi:MAG: VapC toxin family PIN domain ribonuclease [Actinobacteria bacterium HGW-Actinobacteria-7]|nr:MAG: VapC toxin family PIN domain ribonuclease [Actinobacteria bacterium HGW-Actinobacteria-7]